METSTEKVKEIAHNLTCSNFHNSKEERNAFEGGAFQMGVKKDEEFLKFLESLCLLSSNISLYEKIGEKMKELGGNNVCGSDKFWKHKIGQELYVVVYDENHCLDKIISVIVSENIIVETTKMNDEKTMLETKTEQMFRINDFIITIPDDFNTKIKDKYLNEYKAYWINQSYILFENYQDAQQFWHNEAKYIMDQIDNPKKEI